MPRYQIKMETFWQVTLLREASSLHFFAVSRLTVPNTMKCHFVLPEAGSNAKHISKTRWLLWYVSVHSVDAR